MISSKDLMAETGISRATLNNYIQLGLLPRPEVSAAEGDRDGRSRMLGYFPSGAVARIEMIQVLKRDGLTMDEVARTLANEPVGDTNRQLAPAFEAVSAGGRDRAKPKKSSAYSEPADNMSRSHGRGLPVSLEGLTQPAYMVNYNMELVWYNDQARTELFGFNNLPDHSKERCLFRLFSRPESRLSLADQRAFAALNLRFALLRVGRSALERVLEQSDPDLLEVLHAIEPFEGNPQQAIAESQLHWHAADGVDAYHVYALYFREGMLMVLSPETDARDDLLDFLARRDRVIENLLRKRMPVLSPLAVLVADLQHSVRICSELPPDEYFELINEIWSTMAPILRKYGGTYGKHVGDGMVYYFFPQPESSYLFNAIACASELREAMHKISSEWQFRKRWFTELQLNIGLHEGEEWLGTFQSTNHVEFVVLGDTINHAARLSDFARQGSIWATKSLVSRLTPDERSRVEFGVLRQSQEFGDRFIPASYAQIDTLIPVSQDRYEKLRDIGHLAVTEIRRVSMTRSY